MPTAVINGVRVRLNLQTRLALSLDMSLQRHHYRYCGAGAAQPMNSLLYASVTNEEVITDVLEVGQQMERLLNNDHRAKKLYGVEFKCKIGRVYLVDNAGLNPNAFPNHFFPTRGPSLWQRMSQNEYVAGRSAVRRVEEAINAKPAKSRTDFLDGDRLRKIRQEPGGAANAVVAAYVAARTALNAVAAADPMLAEVSTRNDIVTLARSF